MRFSVDQDSRTSIYLQIKDQILYAISVGELRAGDPLPSIRELEAELGINRNTIRRAYLELESEGTLTIRQGKKARVAAGTLQPHERPSDSQAEALALRMVKEAEGLGFDGVQFASAFERAAADHDRRYAKCAFIECSQYQADDFACATRAAWGRHVEGMDLNRLLENVESLPSSTQYVLTTHWHLADVQWRLKERVKAIHGVNVKISPAFYEGVHRLNGLRTGLILRDPESEPGYRKLVRELVDVKGDVPVALMGNYEAERLMDSVEGIVYTTPCRGFTADHAPHHLVTQELLYVPDFDDLNRIREDLFPTQ
ncbi:MAG: GntR family transcriptional regulator [Gemmatimonadetes bacterium]|nr:GntR family transcriptional regulator [Gemmatimonadota bacterium]MDE3259625.1 GntR family transcriptional regulator [Gemmatimonadota bacterium]